MGRLEHSIAIRPCRGELHSGDIAVIQSIDETTTLAAIVDVTGHGYAANKTAIQIGAFLQNCRATDIVTLMKNLHKTLSSTQGAAVGLCLINTDSGLLQYTGTGNTVFKCYGEKNTQLISRDGIVGLNMGTPQIQTLTLNNRDLLLMYTDGISDKFRFQTGSGAQHQHTSLITDKLINDFSKNHDDAGCIALRYRDY